MVKIKFCGMQRREDVFFAAKAGANFVGFIFYRPSPRYVSPEEVKRFIFDLPQSVKKVGVFVNEELSVVRTLHRRLGLDVVQFHGDESPEYCRRALFPYWKVIRVKEVASLKQADAYDTGVFLLDTHHPSHYGGTGSAFDWKMISQGWSSEKRFILSGGLNLKNIRAAADLRPFALDMNSGVEDSPGIKNHVKMTQVIEGLRKDR